MAQRGAYTRRNAGHKAEHARRFAGAANDRDRLAAAFGWFRSSALLLARRRPPRGTGQDVHRAASARLIREAAQYLKERAEEIDRGDHDARKGDSR